MTALCAEKDALRVDVEDGVPSLGGGVLHASVEEDARVVDQHVHLAVLRNCRLDRHPPAVLTRDVEVDVDAVSAGLGNLRRDSLPLGVQQVADDNLGAFEREHAGLGRALPSRAAADEGYLAFKPAHGVPPELRVRCLSEDFAGRSCDSTLAPLYGLRGQLTKAVSTPSDSRSIGHNVGRAYLCIP